jgi:NADH-quinone oxidoreductase subunit L
VILALHHEQDMFKMGGLKKYLPITWATMGIATLAIAGIPPFAGFFSKDEILWNSLVSDHGALLLWIIGVAVAGMTAFYMARLMYLTFYGEERFDSKQAPSHGDAHGHSHVPKEPSKIVTIPLGILAFFSLVGGLVGLPAWLGDNRFEAFLEPSFHHAYTGEHHAAHSHALEIGLTVLVVGLALVAIYIAYRLILKRPGVLTRFTKRYPGLYNLVWKKFYVDEIYDALIVWPIVRLSRGFLWKGVDVGIIDGAVNGTAWLAQRWSEGVRRLQNGYARVYGNWILLGAVVISLYYYFTN